MVLIDPCEVRPQKDHHHQFRNGQSQRSNGHGLLSAIKPKAALFLGKCGGLEKERRYRRPYLANRGHTWRRNINDYFPRRYLPCRHSHSKKRSRPRFVTQRRITGPERYTPRTDESGNRMKNSKNTTERSGLMAIDMETATIFSTAFQTKFPPAHCCSSPINHGPGRCENRSSDVMVTKQYVETAFEDRNRFIEAADQQWNDGETSEILTS